MSSCLWSLAVLEIVAFLQWFQKWKKWAHLKFKSIECCNNITDHFISSLQSQIKAVQMMEAVTQKTHFCHEIFISHSRQKCDSSLVMVATEKRNILLSESTKMFSIPLAIYYCDVGVNHCAWLTHLIGACETWCFHETMLLMLMCYLKWRHKDSFLISGFIHRQCLHLLFV